ncbi:MAG: DNA polymerase III subunit alpha, partial [Sulfuricellaceae bacterium]|nr:DNA polymerase III subunit alpha [Sulfuricellaceae bacterium]
AHHTAAFMAATLSSELDNTDQLRVFYEDTLANGVKVLGPDINLSRYRFEPVSGKEIRYGLGAIKGTGESAINAILKVREDGAFQSLFDFCNRVDKRVVNRRTIESLIRGGAFDSIGDHRASLLASVGMAMEAAEQSSRNASQCSLFAGDEPGGHSFELIKVPRWPEPEQLQQEKSSLGFYFSGHPFTAYREELSRFVRTKLCDLSPQAQPVLMAGVVYAIRTQLTRRGKMAIVSLDDGSCTLEVTVFNELYEANRKLLVEDRVLIVEGKISKDNYSGGQRVTAEKLYDLAGARSQFAQSLQLSINGQADSERLRGLLSPYRQGGCPVKITYQNGSSSCEMTLGDAWKIQPHDDLLQALAEWLTPGKVNLVYR